MGKITAMRAAIASLAILACAGSAAAAEPPSALKDLAACAALSEAGAKAQCYDAAYAAFAGAVAAGDVLIVERRQAEAVQRGAFGFNLPSLDIFQRSGGKPVEPLETLVSEAKSLTRDRDGKWVVTLADGAVWRQIDDMNISPAPKAGQKVEIVRAAFGSYLMRIGDRKGVRARRVE